MIVLVIICVVIILYLFLVFPASAAKEQRLRLTGRNYAHRGLHSNDGELPPENTLEAFDAACRHGYGMELDVQYSSDNRVVVFHDNDLQRACGDPRKVWNCPLDELRAARLFGRDYHIPLFSEVLDTVAGRGPLIVEIKAEGRNTKIYDRLCRDTWELLKNYKGDWCVESFHPAVVRWWRKNHPEVVRGQLAMGAGGYEMNGAIRFVLSRLLANCAGRPHFIAYEYRAAGFNVRMCRLLGAMPVAWTVKTPDDAPSAEKNYDMVIFEGYTPDPIYKTNKQR